MKKHLCILIIMICLSNFLIGQSTTNLDEKNGFKDLKIGDNYLKWKGDLKLEGEWGDGTQAFSYIGNCCDKIFEYSINKIILRFKNNQIIAIYITVPFQEEYFANGGVYTKWRTDDFNNINSSFETLFGRATSVKMDEKTSGVINFWQGKKISLSSAYEFLGTTKGDQQKISIISNEFIVTEVNNGF